MEDFEMYLRSINAERFKTIETQTEYKIKKCIKVGVNSEKLGILKDKETYIDKRMF